MPKAILILLACLLLAAPAAKAEDPERALPYQGETAEGWKAIVSDYKHAPAFLIAVDKKGQRVSLFERKSPLSKIAEYTCTTGQNEGDKLVEGDLKTPEGVYFVVRHITSGLDYTLYGHEAYPLNYPNPVDRIRKKTGHGIWIHGKGIPVVPYDTNGCVGMQNEDIATFKKLPLIGQPVTMAVNVSHEAAPNQNKSATAAALVGKVEAWAKAWSGRSAELFDFYNPELYSLAQRENFKAFKAQKESLFKILPWIDTRVSDVQVLEGPGYWVTWFNQDYKAPNLTSFGTRRLYWQPDENGELRIVGMEWINGFKSPVLYAELRQPVQSDAGGKSTALAAANKNVAESTPASKSAAATKSTAPAKSAPIQPSKVQDPVLGEIFVVLSDASMSASDYEVSPETMQSLERLLVKEGRDFIVKWQSAWKNRNLEAYALCYAPKARQDRRQGLQNIMAHKAALWQNIEVHRLDFSDVRMEIGQNGIKVTMRQDYADSRDYSDKGEKTLHLKFDKFWRIVNEEWRPL